MNARRPSLSARKMKRRARDAQILALRGTMSNSAIAAKLKTTPSVVSGVFYRADTAAAKTRKRATGQTQGLIRVMIYVHPDIHSDVSTMARARRAMTGDVYADGIRQLRATQASGAIS